MSARVRAVTSVFRSAFGNAVLRKIGLAYALFGASEFGIWITLLVFAYGHGGPTASMTMILVQVFPSILLGSFFGAFVDHHRPSGVLRLGYGLQSVTMAGVALAMGLGAPTFVVFLLAPLTALSLTMTRPSQAALLPAIVRTPNELTAANVISGWTDGAAAMLGPGLVGLLLAWRGPWLAVTATAGMCGASLLLMRGVSGPAPTILADEASDDDIIEDEGSPPDRGPRRHPLSALSSIRDRAGSHLLVTLRNRQIRVLLTLHTFYFVLIGSIDFLCVILAQSLLHMGAGGAGYLNSALGGGALLAGFVTAFLVGQRHLSATLIVALSVAVSALALIGVFPGVILAFLLIGAVGLSGAVFDITGRTLLQRSAPSDAIAGSFSILEALMDLGLALGAILIRVSIAIVGVRAALFAPAIVALVLIAILGRKLQNIDASATVPQVEIQLLRSLAIFASLPPPSLEGMARELVPVTATPGTAVITQGDPGDCYYAVAQGELAISRDGQLQQTISRGEGFGEIALIRDIPRQASVTAVTDVLLYSLHKEMFVQTVTGHASAARATGTIIAVHLGDTGGDDVAE
jgi:MFS family permease